MSAKIRLVRIGTKSKPFYRIAVIDESSARNARTIDVLGYYDPKKEPTLFEIDKEKVELWLKKGAQPSDVVRKYLGKAGILPPLDVTKMKKRAPKKEAPAEPAAAPAA